MKIFTDGSCYPNPGPGGFGVIVYDNNKIIHCYSEREQITTNNRMELKAILYAMKTYGAPTNDFLRDIPQVFSDSNYCVQTFNEWMFGWARNNWKKKDGTVPENLDLIQEYYDLYYKDYRIELKKVKGHIGIAENELVDKLAKGEIIAEDILNDK